MEEYGMSTDKQYDGQLIDEYNRLMKIRKIAAEENSPETVKAIDNEIDYIKLKLRPLQLPDDREI